MSALKYWVWLSDSELSLSTIAAILERYGDAERAFFAPEGELSRLDGVRRADAERLERRALDRAEEVLARCHEQGITTISYQDSEYPERLKNIFAPPPVLYVKGKLPQIDENAVVALVGTRAASPYGLRMSRGLAGEIIQCGGIIASGLTRGVDAAAAEGALSCGGICVGVLGTAHEQEDGSLAESVAMRGAVVSEHAPGTESRRSFFRRRNRITAGLAVGVVAVEAPRRSGTRLFVDEAVQQGKEIFAVPANADALNSEGTLDFLKDGAKLVTCGWDVMGEFEWQFPGKLHPVINGAITRTDSAREGDNTAPAAKKPDKKTKKVIDKGTGTGYIDLKDQLDGLSEAQLKIISAIDGGGSHIDDIIEATGLGAAAVLAQLTVLEIKGFVRREAGRRIALNTAKK